jgi:hypothetical protein
MIDVEDRLHNGNSYIRCIHFEYIFIYERNSKAASTEVENFQIYRSCVQSTVIFVTFKTAVGQYYLLTSHHEWRYQVPPKN